MTTNKSTFLLIIYSLLLFSCSAQSKNEDYEKKNSELNDQNKSLQFNIDSISHAVDTKSYSAATSNFSYDIASSIINFKNKQYTVFIVDPTKYQIELFNIDEKDNSKYDFTKIRTKLKEENKVLLMAANAGMYKKDRTPQGLYINRGIQVANIDTAKLNGKGNFYDLPPNGIFTISFQNIAQVITTDNFLKLDSVERSNVKLATQSGPMILIDGKANSYFKNGSSNLNIRNAVGINSRGEVVFAISNEQVNFYEFAEFYQSLDCKNALYLDGAISKMAIPGLYLPSTMQFEDKLPNTSHLGPIIAVFK